MYGGMVMQVIEAFWDTALQMAPWLLFGFLAAGLLSLFFTPEAVCRRLGRGAGKRAVLLAVLLGVPLPLCSCGVLPMAVGLRKGGASKGATAAFLISTPQTGVDSFFATYSLLGGVFAWIRPVVALITGLIGGFWVDALDATPELPAETARSYVAPTDRWGKRLWGAVQYGFGRLLADVAPALLVGLLLSAMILAFVPTQFFAEYALGSDWVAFPVMLLIGMPMYVCSTASIPVALALMAKGLSPGAALIFLIVGPALNGASLTTLLRLLGKRCTLIHLMVIAVAAVLAGLALNGAQAAWGLLPDYSAVTTACCAEASPVMHAVRMGSAVGLLLLLAWHLAVVPLCRLRRPTTMPTSGGCLVKVRGLRCDHCRATVQRLLAAYPGVEEVKQEAPDSFWVKGGPLPGRLGEDLHNLGFELEQ